MHPVRPPIQQATKSLTLTVTTRGHNAAVQANGHLDRSTGSLLAAVIEHEIRRGYRQISVNLDQIGSIDEAGLLALRQAHQALRVHGGHLDVHGADPSRLAHSTATSACTPPTTAPSRSLVVPRPPVQPSKGGAARAGSGGARTAGVDEATGRS